MKSNAKKSTTATSASVMRSMNPPFFAKAGGGGFFTPAVQPKLKVGQPGGKLEQEADVMADKVMRMPEPAPMPEKEEPRIARQEEDRLQRQPETEDRIQEQQEEEEVQRQPKEEIEEDKLHQQAGEEEGLQRQPETEDRIQEQQEEEEVQRQPKEETEEDTLQQQAGEEEEVWRKSDEPPAVTAQIQSDLSRSLTGGQPMGSDTRNFMESRFNADFSGIKIHTDSKAAVLSQQLHAKAFTYKNHIFFAKDQHQPGTDSGRRLLAHELTHTIQQGEAVRRKASISTVSAPLVQRVPMFIKKGINWVLDRIIPGYTLLNVILGKNIVTDEPVARTGINIIQGYMRLSPVIGSILFNELKETNTLIQAGAWVEGKIAEIGIDFNDIARRLRLAWDEMSIWKGIDGNAAVFKKHVGPVYFKILVFSGAVMEKVKELRLEGALLLVGATKLLAALKKDPAAFNRVVDQPSLILKNFMGALKKGFSQFRDNFGTHFKNALFGWLFGKAAEMGVTMPKQFNVAGLFHLAAQLVGATYQQIKARVIKKLGRGGAALYAKLESTVQVVKDLVTKGPVALWDLVKNFLKNMKEMLFSKIKDLVLVEIVKAAVGKLVTMLNPAGAIVQLVLTIYRVVKFFIDWWDRIKELAQAVMDAVTDVALGKIAGASNYIEKIMAKGMTLVIAFLARIFGLGGIVAKVKALIEKISGPIRKAIDWAINWIVRMAGPLIKKAMGLVKKGKKWVVGKAKGVVGGVRGLAGRVARWWTKRTPFTDTTGQSHNIRFRGAASNAELVVESTVMVVRDAINLARSKAASNAEKQAVKEAARLRIEAEAIIERLQSRSQGAYDPSDIDRINATLNQLANVMKILVPLIAGPTPTSPFSLPVTVGDLISYNGRHWIIHSFDKFQNMDMVRIKRLVPAIKAANAEGHGLPDFAKDIQSGRITKISDKLTRRELFMGSTPGETSGVGNAVKARMIALGKYDPKTNKFFNARNNTWYPLSQADMGHVIDASVWWNSNGRFKGPKAPEVRQFMTDPDNYEFEESNQNRLRGAAAPNYLPPVT